MYHVEAIHPPIRNAAARTDISELFPEPIGISINAAAIYKRTPDRNPRAIATRTLISITSDI
jgi:hypothetical protein